MGDRYNMRRDEDEARHYREETPRWRQVLDRAAMLAFVIGVPGLILAAMIYKGR